MADLRSQLQLLQEELRQVEQRAEQERLRAEKADGRSKAIATEWFRCYGPATTVPLLRIRNSRAEQAEEQTQRTTLEELLEACHHLSQSMSVQTDKSLSTQGSTTSPKGKRCPTMLRPWNEFPSIQQRAFDELYIQELGRTIQDRKIASEEDLKMFHHSAVENFITDIFSVLASNHQYRGNIALGHGVIFENHSNTLSDLDKDVEALLQSATSSSSSRRASKPIYADQL